MRLRRSAARGPLAFVLLSTAILTGTGFVGGAHADPVSGAGKPGYPSQSQVDQANQAANAAGAAVTPAQAALVSAQQELARTEAVARQAEGLYKEAAAHERAAQQAATSAAQHAQDSASFAATAKIELGRLVAAAYRSGAALDLSSLTMVLDVKDPQGYMNGVRVVKRLLASQSSIVTQSADASRDANAAQTQTKADAASVRAAEASVAQSATDAEKAQATAQAQVTALGAQLDELLAEKAAAQSDAAQLEQQRQEAMAAEAAGGGADVGVAPNASGIAAQVIAYAMAQVGKPYLWGGTGPGAFDCSGLAMRAYESAGIDLPHFAAFQYQASHPLAYSQLQPGDLLFWATNAGDSNTIYHEAIYLGGQKMVQAPKTGWDVMVSDMWMWGPIQFYARPAVAVSNQN